MAGFANLYEQRQVMKERRVPGINQVELAGFLGARQKMRSKFLPVNFPQFVPKYIEKQGVMGRKYGFNSMILSPQKVRQIVADSDGVVFIQRRNRVINIDVF